MKEFVVSTPKSGVICVTLNDLCDYIRENAEVTPIQITPIDLYGTVEEVD